MTKVHDEPSRVTAENGEVEIDGPGGIVVSLTPAAAAETADRLRQGAEEAEGQQAVKRETLHTKP